MKNKNISLMFLLSLVIYSCSNDLLDKNKLDEKIIKLPTIYQEITKKSNLSIIKSSLGEIGPIKVDNNGNIFFSESFEGRIRKIDKNGEITIIAGGGKTNTVNGELTKINSLAVENFAIDSNGNIFFLNHHTINKIDLEGNISLFAGNIENKNWEFKIGNEETIDDQNKTEIKDNVPATESLLVQAYGIAIGKYGDVYISDEIAGLIRKVDTKGIISTIAGTGKSGFSGDGGDARKAQLRPHGIFVDQSNKIYIDDFYNNRIRMIDEQGIISTIAGSGAIGYKEENEYDGDNKPATEAQLHMPQDVIVDNQGNIFVADTRNGRIRKIDTKGIITTVAGGGSENNSEVATKINLTPTGIAIDLENNLYIADRFNKRICKVNLNIK